MLSLLQEAADWLNRYMSRWWYVDFHGQMRAEWIFQGFYKFCFFEILFFEIFYSKFCFFEIYFRIFFKQLKKHFLVVLVIAGVVGFCYGFITESMQVSNVVWFFCLIFLASDVLTIF